MRDGIQRREGIPYLLDQPMENKMSAYERDIKRIRNRNYRKNHPDYMKQWRQDHPEKVNEYLKKEYSSDYRRAYMRLYMRAYRDTLKECAQ